MGRKSRNKQHKANPAARPAQPGVRPIPGSPGKFIELPEYLEELLAPLLPPKVARPSPAPKPAPKPAPAPQAAEPAHADTKTMMIDGVSLTVSIERKNVKNINARLHENHLSVSVPLHVKQDYLDEAIPTLARRLIRRQHARTINQEDNALELAQKIAARFPKPPQIENVIFVTTQESRWGSYSSATHTIRINAALRHMPPWVLEAVIAHELAHTVHFDHSPEFWALLRHVCPDTDRARAFLYGVSWLSRSWDKLPPIERSILGQGDAHFVEEE